MVPPLQHRRTSPIPDQRKIHWPETLTMGHDSLDTTTLYIQGTKQDLHQAAQTIAWT